MNYQIEKGVPMPAGRGYRRWPFGEMEVGDSFCVQSELAPRAVNADFSFSRAKVGGKIRGWKFENRKQADGTHRIWRVS